jgi:hypothetical protein
MKMTKTLKALKAIPKNVVAPEPPPLECERPHAKIARLTREMTETTEAIQTLKRTFAARNMKAQQLRQCVSSAEITAHQAEHSRLAARLAALQTELGDTNRELRANKAERQSARHVNGGPVDTPEPRSNGAKLTGPVKSRPDFCVYFRLAAENELEPRLFQHIERVAKTMIHAAIENGVES